MEKVSAVKKRNFFKEYPVADKIHPPKPMLRKLSVWLITALLILVNVLLLVIFFTTYTVRRMLQLVGLVAIRGHGCKELEIKPKSQQSPARKVCVIGCGASGLLAVKECLENGLEVDAYDKDTEVGGVFATSYDNGRMTSSNVFTAFSSLPCQSEDLPSRFWSFKEYQVYLKKFVAHFHLDKHLRLGHRVDEVSEVKDGQWKVTVTECSTEQTVSRVYDHIIVCSGVNQEPVIPEQVRDSRFQGVVMHSSEYRNAKGLVGKRVLVVGLGESGSDISFDVSQDVANVCIITRNGPGAVIPRFNSGLPSDADSNRLYYGLPRSLFRDDIRWWKVKVWLESLFFTKQDEELRQAINKVQYTRRHWMSKYGTKTANFVWAVVQNGGKYMETSIRELDEKGAVFANGSRYDCDVIICCSGYRRSLPFLPPELQNLNYRNDLWKKTIHPRFGTRIAFVGFSRPNIGTIPTIAELAARFVSLAMAGRVELPSQEDMKKTMDAERAYEEKDFDQDYKRLSGLCSYLETMLGWARILGCEVNYTKLLITDPALFWGILSKPILAAQFRLFGEGSDYKKARSAIMIVEGSHLMVVLYNACLSICSAVLFNLGLSEPPFSFPLL